MALQKTFTTKGIDADYWTITSYLQDKINNSTYVVIRLYKDAATRTESISNFVESIDVTVPGYELTLEEIYEAVKSAETPYDTFTEEEVEDEANDATQIIKTRVPFFSDAGDN